MRSPSRRLPLKSSLGCGDSLAKFSTVSATVSTYSADVEGPSLKTYGSGWTTSAEYFAKASVKGRPTLESPPSHFIVTSEGEARLTSPT